MNKQKAEKKQKIGKIHKSKPRKGNTEQALVKRRKLLREKPRAHDERRHTEKVGKGELSGTDGIQCKHCAVRDHANRCALAYPQSTSSNASH